MLVKKLFLLWDRHTIGCCRALFGLLIPAAVWPSFALIYCNFCLVVLIIIKAGYESNWRDSNRDY